LLGYASSAHSAIGLLPYRASRYLCPTWFVSAKADRRTDGEHEHVNSRRVTPWVVAGLILAGAVCVSLRARALWEMELTDGDRLWRLTYMVKFVSARVGAKVRVALPSDTPYGRVFRQDVVSPGMRAVRTRPSRPQTREVNLVTMSAGEHTLTAKFDIHQTPRPHWRAMEPDPNLSADARAQALQGTATIQVSATVVSETLKRLRRDGAGPVDAAQRLYDYCATEIAHGDAEAPQDAAGALEHKTATPLGRARALVALCRASKIPARLVTGFELHREAEVKPHTWVEVLTNHHWDSYDPENGYARELPHRFVPVRRGGLEIVQVRDAPKVQSSFAVVELPPGLGLSRFGHRHPLQVFDLTRLPLEMHEVLAIILLLPLGALVTSVFRTIIGVRTFGTFTPTLIALSFIFNDWRTGLVVFALVLALGLASRSALDRLRLLMVPRLSIILTLVVLCIISAVSLLDYLKWTPSAQAVLLPMVILTMTVERFYLTTEEDGVGFAVQLLAGTLVVGFCCYGVLCWRAVGNVLLGFPEVHLFTIAALVLIGRYTGYRLTELWRFRDLPASRA
jgi:transglutaminase-like putative cysteine protease